MSFQGKVVLITGASSGIGAALAREFFRLGSHLVLVARRLERLEQLKAELQKPGQNILIFQADVTRPADLTGVVEWVHKELGNIDVVIANAGYGVMGQVDELSVKHYENQFATNVFGVLHTFYAVKDDLLKTQGVFSIMGSVMSYLALPGSSPYSMSKYAVRALAESLRAEWFGKVTVNLTCPGFIRSEFRQVGNDGKLYAGISDPLPLWIQMPGETAARKICQALAKKKGEYVLTLHGKLIVFLVRHFPWMLTIATRYFGVRGRQTPVSHVA